MDLVWCGVEVGYYFIVVFVDLWQVGFDVGMQMYFVGGQSVFDFFEVCESYVFVFYVFVVYGCVIQIQNYVL